MRKKAILIANPVAKRFSLRRLEKAVRLLNIKGIDVNVRLTSFKGEAESLARNLSDGDTIIAAGGDGTFNEVINGIALKAIRMAIIPMGTTNVLAKELGIEENIEGAVARILHGKEHILSLGQIFLKEPHISRYFCLMAGIGFDGEAVYSCSSLLKRPLGKASYILSGLRTLIRFNPAPLVISFNSGRKTGYSAIIGKASKYGGHFRITPDASLFNPDLYIYLMHGRKRLDILRYVTAIIFGKHLGLKDVKYFRASEIDIQGMAKVQVDGDFLGYTPATIKVVPDALRMLF